METLLRISVLRGVTEDNVQRKILANVLMTIHSNKKAKEKATAAKERLIKAEERAILRDHRRETGVSQLLETERKEREVQKAEQVTGPLLSAEK